MRIMHDAGAAEGQPLMANEEVDSLFSQRRIRRTGHHSFALSSLAKVALSILLAFMPLFADGPTIIAFDASEHEARINITGGAEIDELLPQTDSAPVPAFASVTLGASATVDVIALMLSEDLAPSAAPALGGGSMLGDDATLVEGIALADDTMAPDVFLAREQAPPLMAMRPQPAVEAVAAPLPASRIVAVRRGDTLMDILLSLGLARAEAHEAVSALAAVFDPRGLRPGQEITFSFAPGDRGALVGAWLTARADRDVGLTREPGGRFTAHQRDRTLSLEATRAAGMVRTSLYEAGLATGVPVQVMVEMIRIFSFDVDFQRDIQPGDAYEILFERFRDDTGRVAKDGAVRYASLLLSGRRLAVYRHIDRDGNVDYYNEKGESVRKALLKTPIDGARLTSGFGSRMHPILGYSAFHKGVDFGAVSGTPIQAAGDGTVEMKGWFGGYGNYVRLRHNSEYATAYAHMSRYAAGLTEGARVRQGQIIGYVGTTGRSTGAHLHYEVLRRGAQINPIGVKFPSGRKLEGTEFVAFKNTRVEADHALATAETPTQLVALPPEPRPLAPLPATTRP